MFPSFLPRAYLPDGGFTICITWSSSTVLLKGIQISPVKNHSYPTNSKLLCDIKTWVDDMLDNFLAIASLGQLCILRGYLVGDCLMLSG